MTTVRLHTQTLRKTLTTILKATFVLTFAIAGAQAQAPSKWLEELKDPTEHELKVASQGYFFVGGQYFTASDGQQYMAKQMYVEYQATRHIAL